MGVDDRECLYVGTLLEVNIWRWKVLLILKYVGI